MAMLDHAASFISGSTSAPMCWIPRVRSLTILRERECLMHIYVNTGSPHACILWSIFFELFLSERKKLHHRVQNARSVSCMLAQSCAQSCCGYLWKTVFQTRTPRGKSCCRISNVLQAIWTSGASLPEIKCRENGRNMRQLMHQPYVLWNLWENQGLKFKYSSKACQDLNIFHLFPLSKNKNCRCPAAARPTQLITRDVGFISCFAWASHSRWAWHHQIYWCPWDLRKQHIQNIIIYLYVYIYIYIRM